MGPAAVADPRAWEALTPPLSEWILDAVAAMGFGRMTPVQTSTIPLFMGNKDVVVEAVTGSGKTMAFLIPLVEKLLRLESPIKKHHVGAIIVSPTRELAEQIYNVLLSLLAFHEPSSSVIKTWNADDIADGDPQAPPSYSSSTRRVIPQLLLGGSTTPAEDLSTFLKRSPNFLISTPGRLLELLSSPHVHCPQSSFEVLVLDEADRLLDLGFKEDLQKILARLPKQRRTGLFSASVSDAVDQIIRVGLRNPVKVAIKVKGASGAEDKRTPASLKMTYLLTPPSHGFPAVKQLLTSMTPTPQKSILYFSTCAAVDYWSYILPTLFPADFVTIPLHGKHPPHARQKNFTRFTNSVSPSILLTTDVAARGLDIPSVDLVVQVDPPSDPKVYLHRCGRAGRAGRRGLSVILLSPGREEDYIAFLDVRKTPATHLDNPTISTSAADASATTETIRSLVLHDRALHDKAQRAFVSWLRSYSKHQASSIFRVSDLDWEELGRAWGLLKLPRMPELRRFFSGDGTLGVKLDWDSYAYKDKQREKHRQEEALEGERTQENGSSHSNDATPKKRSAEKVNAPWSKTIQNKGDKERRRERKLAKRDNDRWERLTDAEKEAARETERMVNEVRKTTQAKRQQPGDDHEEEFNGFD